MSKIIASVIALIYLIVALIFFGIESFLILLVYLIFTLVFIWFGDEMGDIMGLGGPYHITQASPASMIGWLLLFLPLIMGLIVLLLNS